MDSIVVVFVCCSSCCCLLFSYPFVSSTVKHQTLIYLAAGLVAGDASDAVLLLARVAAGLAPETVGARLAFLCYACCLGACDAAAACGWQLAGLCA
jgi:hypothetical protein